MLGLPLALGLDPGCSGFAHGWGHGIVPRKRTQNGPGSREEEFGVSLSGEGEHGVCGLGSSLIMDVRAAKS